MSASKHETQEVNPNLNSPYFKQTLIAGVKQKMRENEGLPRKGTSFNLNQELMEEVYKNLQRAGFITYNGKNMNRVIEACLALLNDVVKEDTKQMQFVIAQNNIIAKNITFNIKLTQRQRIEYFMTKEELAVVLNGLKRPNNLANHEKKLQERLRKVLPKAAEYGELTQDAELNALLKQAEVVFSKKEQPILSVERE
jgi:hypothetical protein